MSEDDSLFSVIRLIAEHECVLVRSKDKKISGLVTTADLALTFDQLGEPFLMLGEIENHVRAILSVLPLPDLASGKDPEDVGREVNSVSDLTFGEYVRLLENPKIWDKLKFHMDKSILLAEIQRVRYIRNDVMHFDPDGLGEGELKTLRRVAKFLRDLREMGITGPTKTGS